MVDEPFNTRRPIVEDPYAARRTVVEERSSGSLAFIVGGLVIAVAFIIWLLAGSTPTSAPLTTPADTNITIDNAAPAAPPAAEPVTPVEPAPVTPVVPNTAEPAPAVPPANP